MKRIIQDEKEVRVETRNDEKYSATYLIMAMPPPAVRNITF